MNSEKYKKLKELLISVSNGDISIFEMLKSFNNGEDYVYYRNNYSINDRAQLCLNDPAAAKQFVRILDFCSVAKSFCEKRRETFGEPEEITKENEDAETIDLSMDWDDLEETDLPKVASTYDGLVLSLSNKAKVDIKYISKVCDTSPEQVIIDLDGIIYLNPETWNENPYKGWETSDEYLSGLMASKLKKAIEANGKYPFLFKKNIDAINKIYPNTVHEDEIYITLGSPWVPTSIIDNFIEHLVAGTGGLVKHDNYTGTWDVPSISKHSVMDYYSARAIWGTRRCSALKLIENSLNLKKVTIYDTKYGVKKDGSHGDITVLNEEETALAQEKQQEINEEFQKWVWNNPSRKKKLLKIYEEKYASYVRRIYDGSFLTFPGMNKSVELFDYQKNAVARILYSKNVLLAHDVGAGKTYEMIAAGMELRRIGLAKKILYVVPNNIVGQWKSTFSQLYPQANILVVEPRTFKPDRRQGVLESIKNNDYDGIIMAYSCFDQIPLSKEIIIKNLLKNKEAIKQVQSSYLSDTHVLRKRLETINKKIIELITEPSQDKGICFDELDIDRLFLDEAHNYKNVPIQTKMTNILGINATGSKRCKDMLDKVRVVQSKSNGGLVMATGTPLTNSVSEAYTIQRYLQPGELNLLDLKSFDAWAGMFAEITCDFEIDVTTNSYRLATRFSKFHNLKELTNLLSSVADFHRLDKTNGIPNFTGYTDIKIEKTKEFDNFLKEISERADKVRSRKVLSSDDNMLLITTDGRKAALDLRLIDENFSFDSKSKVSQCAKNVFMEYCSGNEEKTTQLIFCDTSCPKIGFNMYDELTRLLVGMGVKKEEIAYIHEATTEKKRDELYKKVRDGEIRILIGSTFKLGLGVNVQDKAIALHHLDIPWRPSDMTQREGRILRQGNTNESVNIYRYVTEGSFDAYSWQLLETKQKFISDLLSGSLDVRDGDEIDDVVLSYGEIKALAIGDPSIKERVELINEIARQKLIQSKKTAIRIENQKVLIEIPSRIKIAKDLLDKANRDYEYVKALSIKKSDEMTEKEKEERNDLRDKLDELLTKNVLMPTERVAFDYYGFTVILPKEMTKDEPYVYMQKVGKYKLEMGESKKGKIIRLENFITRFSKIIDDYSLDVQRLENQKKDIESELFEKDNSYELINELKTKLDKIDEKLRRKYEQ